MSASQFAGGVAVGAVLVGLGAFVTVGPFSARTAYPYCFQFEPTQDITTIEFADIVKIWGAGGGVRDPIKAWGKTADDYGGHRFIERQFKRCDP